ncbi:MAG: class I SAM-dependent methyltransferase [Candidatus Hydrogenedentes bacterium]|nr:class I SAM-dependent methyltransferase [Candidatus Hydrogenedentota bacterium]
MTEPKMPGWKQRLGKKVIAAVFRIVRRPMVIIQYAYVNKLDRDSNEFTFMNYGYVPLDPMESVPELSPEEEKDRCSIQLYHRLVLPARIEGKDVLEIGCGRGGGAAYMARHLAPKSVTAVDVVKSSVNFCRGFHTVPGLRFDFGDAENLHFPDESFDVVLNVESSHCYNSPDRFLAGVRRVLRPGGLFAFADFRIAPALPILSEQIGYSGMEVIEEEDITANIHAALSRDSERRRASILKYVPASRQPQFLEFAGVEGTTIFEGFGTGTLVYKRYLLRKPTAG